MQKKLLFVLCVGCLLLQGLNAQKTALKTYSSRELLQNVYLVNSYGEVSNRKTDKVFNIEVKKSGSYYFSCLVSMLKNETFDVYLDNKFFETITPVKGGWQKIEMRSRALPLSIAKHEIRIKGNSEVVPMVEDIEFNTSSDFKSNPAATQFLDQLGKLENQPYQSGAAAKILANPQGDYGHDIDISIVYSHFSYIYLETGFHTFSTANTTAAKTLALFNPSNYTESSANVNGNGGVESYFGINVTTPAYYCLMVRAYTAAMGTTDIYHNGVLLYDNAVVGGYNVAMSTTKGGDLNFFTAKLSAGCDTRMVACRYTTGAVRGYNDDYSGGGGDWAWGLASRVKKSFGTDLVQFGFVCAYSPTSTGTCDIYVGNANSNVYSTNYPEFPLLKSDDAIQAANTGYYNCIAWSGGVTANWVWPPSEYSTYSCSNSDQDIACFDHFYANTPVRYPGAWNYTRSAATSANASVDLWALNAHFTHGSVRKPGNDQPHGYDWESKPGGLTRTFHPRNALTNNSFGYGSVVNYYRATGTYASRGATQSYATDADAVKAGVAVFENAKLTPEATEKLSGLVNRTDKAFVARYNELYEQWKKTWEKNAVYSDPSMYCKNDEFKALAAFSNSNPVAAIFITADKFVTSNDHLIGDLLLSLTKEKYGKLLQEVKDERMANPNDREGRYRVHGDHDNGVLYVEKILKAFTPATEVKQEETGIALSVMPNPVHDVLTVKVSLNKAEKLMIKVTSAQTQASRVMLAETTLMAGTYQYRLPITGFAGSTGDLLTVQLITPAGVKTVKVMVVR